MTQKIMKFTILNIKRVVGGSGSIQASGFIVKKLLQRFLILGRFKNKKTYHSNNMLLT